MYIVCIYFVVHEYEIRSAMHCVCVPFSLHSSYKIKLIKPLTADEWRFIQEWTYNFITLKSNEIYISNISKISNECLNSTNQLLDNVHMSSNPKINSLDRISNFSENFCNPCTLFSVLMLENSVANERENKTKNENARKLETHCERRVSETSIQHILR